MVEQPGTSWSTISARIAAISQKSEELLVALKQPGTPVDAQENVDHGICNQGVAGSSPAVGTIDFKDLAIHFRSLLVPLREFCGRPLQNAVQHDQFW